MSRPNTLYKHGRKRHYDPNSGSLTPTITAASGSSTHVQNALDAAIAGSIILIPAGTWHWTTQVAKTLPANVVLMGAGSGTTQGGGDVTVIVDDSNENQPVLSINVPATGVFRMTRLTVQGGTGGVKNNGYFNVAGAAAGSQVRIDHCRLNGSTYTPNGNNNQINRTAIGNGVIGVLDHCILDYWGTGAVYVYNGTNSGNTEWAQATNFGSASFFFFEDNIINGTASSHDGRVTDSYTGGRHVERFNTLTGCCLNEDHATGHSSDDRGKRAHESYGNSCALASGQTEPNFTMAQVGSGTAMIWGNTAATDTFKNGFYFNISRDRGQSGGGTYNQVATPNGWGYCGTQFNGTGSDWDGGTVNSTNTLTGYPCLDSPGRGQGDLLTGDFPSKTNQTTGTIHWPNQVLDPIYIWMNTVAAASGWGGNLYANNSSGFRIQNDVDYYQQASGIQTNATTPFNGTTGVGWGTLANRPTTCTTGVAYFATDQGSWNHSATNPYGVQMSGASGVLYIATATDTWTLSYTPYTYPHPLNTG